MTTFPLRINWPANAAVAVPEKWQRLPDGRIQATYRDQLELRWCLLVTRIMRERGVTPAQAAIWDDEGESYYSNEGAAK